jgi:fungal STAND N-terminal Goodbye domain
MSSTGQATSSSSNIKLIVDDALANYTKITGIDLSTNSFAALLEQSYSPEDILVLLQERQKALKTYRDRNRRLISCLSPAVTIIHAFSSILGEAISLVSVTHRPVNLLTWPRQIPFSPVKAVLTSIDVLLTVRHLNTLFN